MIRKSLLACRKVNVSAAAETAPLAPERESIPQNDRSPD
jgi:hypothetical protein